MVRVANAPPSAGPVLPAAQGEALQAALEAYLQTAEAPGATAAVVTPAGTWAGASGTDGSGTPLVPGSAMAVASITKTFVAAEVMLLSSRGQVDLDTDVARYVELPFDSGGATVREVLAMESGFPLDPVRQVFGLTGDVDKQWTSDEVVDLAVPGTHAGERGGPPVYNNLNYAVLGMLVEEVGGVPLAEALRDDLIGPAGLDRVWVQTGEVPAAPLALPADQRGVVVVDEDGPYLPSRALASAAGAFGGMAADAPRAWPGGGTRPVRGGPARPVAGGADRRPRTDGEDWYGLGTSAGRGRGGARGAATTATSGRTTACWRCGRTAGCPWPCCCWGRRRAAADAGPRTHWGLARDLQETAAP